MKAFGLQWWLAACGLALLLAALQLSSVALNAPVAAPRVPDSHLSAARPPMAEGELLDAPEVEQIQPSAAPGLRR